MTCDNDPRSTEDGGTVGEIRMISRFPIKSVGGRRLERSHVGTEGVIGDRQYGFLDLESGKLCNAKFPRKFGSMLACRAYFVEEPEPRQGFPPIEVLFPDGSTHRNVDDDLNEAMSSYLGRPVKLISSVPRGVENEIEFLESSGMEKQDVYARAVANEYGEQVAVYEQATGETFFDLTPLHIVTTSTIEHFKSINPDAAFDARRYRPNFLIATQENGLVEETWVGRSIRIGQSTIADILLPTPRCVMSTLEHDVDVPLDRATLRTVVKNNTQELPSLGGRWGCAGVYAGVGASGMVEVGDRVEMVPGFHGAPIPAAPS